MDILILSENKFCFIQCFLLSQLLLDHPRLPIRSTPSLSWENRQIKTNNNNDNNNKERATEALKHNTKTKTKKKKYKIRNHNVQAKDQQELKRIPKQSNIKQQQNPTELVLHWSSTAGHEASLKCDLHTLLSLHWRKLFFPL